MNKKKLLLLVVLFAGFFLLLIYYYQPKTQTIKDVKCKVNDLVCISDVLDIVLEKQGVEPAFEVLASFYNSSASGACHDLSHKIGEKAFVIFSQNKKLTLGKKTSFCGYGFYHGFMESLLQTTKDVRLARDFCNYETEATGNPTAWTACYHGIGHGAVDGSDPTTWGDPGKMMQEGFKMCDAVSDTDHKRYLCASGIYNSLEILSRDPKYKIEYLKGDPFNICHNQPKKLKEPCYTNMIPAVLHLTKDDFIAATNYIEKNLSDPEYPTIDDYTTYEMVVLSLFHEFIRMHLGDSDYVKLGVDTCRSLPSYSQYSCFEGLSGGHMKYGEPGKEYIKWKQFCGSSFLLNNEKHACYKHVLSRIKAWYPTDKAKEICVGVEEEYRKYCTL